MDDEHARTSTGRCAACFRCSAVSGTIGAVHAIQQSAAFLEAVTRKDLQSAARIAFGVIPGSLNVAYGAIGSVHLALVRNDRFAASGLAAIAEAIAQAQAPMHDASTALDMMSMLMHSSRSTSFEGIAPATVEGIEALAAGEQWARGAMHALIRYIRIAPGECEQILKMIDALGVVMNGPPNTPENEQHLATLVDGTRQRLAETIVTLTVLQVLLRVTR